MIRSDEHHPKAAVVANAPDGVIAATVGPRLLGRAATATPGTCSVLRTLP